MAQALFLPRQYESDCDYFISGGDDFQHKFFVNRYNNTNDVGRTSRMKSFT
jgi:hypothetical protein